MNSFILRVRFSDFFFSQVPRSDSLFVSIVSVQICVAMMCHPSVVVKLFLVHPLFVSIVVYLILLLLVFTPIIIVVFVNLNWENKKMPHVLVYSC